MSTSCDGGLTWGPRRFPGGSGVGGQPVVQPNGNVIVPYEGGAGIRSFRSIDGGASWQASVAVANVSQHGVAGNLRTSPLPSAEVAGDGKVYVAWQDCGFRSGCTSNDIVYSTSLDGVAWTAKRGSRSTRHRAASTTSSPGSPSTARPPAAARGSRWATTTTRSLRAVQRLVSSRRLHGLDGRRRDVVGRAQGGRSDQPVLDREHEPGRDGRRLHVDFLRRRQLRVPGLRSRQAKTGASSTSGLQRAVRRHGPAGAPCARAPRSPPVHEAQPRARPRASSGPELENDRRSGLRSGARGGEKAQARSGPPSQ